MRMPTCLPAKFSWSNLPQYLTSLLAKDLRLNQAGAVDALTRRYRARPGEEFIHDTWDSLQRNWLACTKTGDGP
ncbi:MAG: hypothetical protein IPQ14_04620 [Candidatus Microthrix sp.]|nr:hypothetical protein [Candidatus Microthrix sp.]